MMMVHRKEDGVFDDLLLLPFRFLPLFIFGNSSRSAKQTKNKQAHECVVDDDDGE